MEHERTAEEVLRHRLRVQRLLAPPPGSAVEVVRLLTCVQSQEHAHAFWSLGMRTAGLTSADVQREFDRGDFVRTHVLRPTWHFVAAEDLRWVLALTSPRVQQINQYRYRQLGLDRATLDRGCALIVAALTGGRHLTRPELGTALADGGIDHDGQRLAYLVMNAELQALICSGPMRGAQHTYALLAERIPVDARDPGLTGSDREEALGEFARRFFVGHGPAGVKDLTRWSSLTTADATAGLERVRDRLERWQVDDQTLWADPDPGLHSDAGPHPDPREAALADDRALLLPIYDEASLSYPQLNFPLAPGHPQPVGTDFFAGRVIWAGEDVGTWRRTVRGRRVVVQTVLAPETDQRGRAAVTEAVQRLATFLGKELELAEA